MKSDLCLFYLSSMLSRIIELFLDSIISLYLSMVLLARKC